MPSPWRYDLMLLRATRGREGAFRKRQLDLARVAAGESVLDVGCGTGTLAIAAARRGAVVHALDPSGELLARARRKAGRKRVPVTFDVGMGESLPYPDGSFDVVLSSLVLHHLSHDDLLSSVREMRRTVKPSGRVFIADVGAGAQHGAGFDLAAAASRFATVGLEVIESGSLGDGFRDIGELQYVLANAA
jgi:ubiquinone/menaquinone biosynthesis C-methylase UbiE